MVSRASPAYGLTVTVCQMWLSDRATSHTHGPTHAAGSTRRHSGTVASSVPHPATSDGNRQQSCTSPQVTATSFSSHKYSGGAATAWSSGPSRSSQDLVSTLASSTASSYQTVRSAA